MSVEFLCDVASPDGRQSEVYPQLQVPGQVHTINVDLKFTFGTTDASSMHITQIMDNIGDPIVDCTAVFRSPNQALGMQGAILCALEKLEVHQLNLVMKYDYDGSSKWGALMTVGRSFWVASGEAGGEAAWSRETDDPPYPKLNVIMMPKLSCLW
jgi:hypothetical protein